MNYDKRIVNDFIEATYKFTEHDKEKQEIVEKVLEEYKIKYIFGGTLLFEPGTQEMLDEINKIIETRIETLKNGNNKLKKD